MPKLNLNEIELLPWQKIEPVIVGKSTLEVVSGKILIQCNVYPDGKYLKKSDRLAMTPQGKIVIIAVVKSKLKWINASPGLLTERNMRVVNPK